MSLKKRLLGVGIVVALLTGASQGMQYFGRMSSLNNMGEREAIFNARADLSGEESLWSRMVGYGHRAASEDYLESAEVLDPK
jgi:hypothetical protein